MLLAVVACKNTPEPEPVTPPAPLPTPVPTVPPPVPTVPADCTDPTVALEALDMVTARAQYEACVAAFPDDPTYLMGKAFTGLALLPDTQPAIDLLASCGENDPVGPSLYGPGGALEGFETNHTDHTASVTANHVLVGTTNPSPFLSSVDWVETEAASDYIFIRLTDSYKASERLTLRLYPQDVYQDGTNVQLTNGMVIDVSRLWDLPYFDMPCSMTGSYCSDGPGESASGTITVNAFGTTPGATIDVSFDMSLPTGCNSGFCISSLLHLTGSVVDTAQDSQSLADGLPLVTQIAQTRCVDEGDCEYGTEILGVIAELCPNATPSGSYDHLQGLATEMLAIAAEFDAAAAHADLAYTFPPGGLFFLEEEAPLNQTDAKLLAGGLRSAAGALDLATGFQVADPNTILAEHAGSYTNGFYDIDTCETESFWGVAKPTLQAQLDGFAGIHSTQADFAGARAELLLGVQTLGQALDLAPTGAGVFDFSNAPGWSDAMQRDVDVVAASLAGTDGSLDSAPVWSVQLDAFFDDVPTIADVTTETGLTQVFVAERYDNCIDDITVPEEAVTWVLEQNRGFPITEDRVDAGQTPLIFDGDAYRAIENADGFPRFMTTDVQDFLSQWD